MKTIVYTNIEYRLVTNVNVDPSRFQATIYKDDNSLDNIIVDASANESIKVYEDGEIVGVYNGYHTLLSASVYDDGDQRVVSIEMLNTDIQSQIATLESKVSTVDYKVTNLEDSQLTQDETIEGLGNSQTDIELALAEVYESIEGE